MEPIHITELNHAVLYVSDVARAVEFYGGVLGFVVVDQIGDKAAFLRAGGSRNHHDLGLIGVGVGAPRPPAGSVGLYHLAWRVQSVEALVHARDVLAGVGALTGQSDHGVSKSLYARDPDGNEFEVMYLLPETEWGPFAERAVTRPLQLP